MFVSEEKVVVGGIVINVACITPRRGGGVGGGINVACFTPRLNFMVPVKFLTENRRVYYNLGSSRKSKQNNLNLF